MSNHIEHPSSGMTGTFAAKYDQHTERNGQSFTVLGALDPKAYDAPECGAMFRIRFADGAEIEAWPEEVESATTVFGKPNVRHPYDSYCLADAIRLANAGRALNCEPPVTSLEQAREIVRSMASSARHTWITGYCALDVLDAAIDGRDLRIDNRLC